MAMHTIKYEEQVRCTVAPERLFKAFVLDGDNLLPKVSPNTFKSIELLKGDGKPGSIKLITFDQGNSYGTSRYVVDELDEKKMVFKYIMVSGDGLMGLEKMTTMVKIEAGSDSESIVKSSNEYYLIDGHKITEENIKEGKDKLKGLFMAVESYLHAHPEEYC